MAEFVAAAEVLRQRRDVTKIAVVRTKIDDADLALGVVEVRGYVAGAELREYVWLKLGDDDALDGVLVVKSIPSDGENVDLGAIAEAARQEGKSLLFHPPSDELEAEIAAMWATVLDVPRVSIHDDFMDLGGESGAAVRITVELERRLGSAIDVNELLDAGTISGLAQLVRERAPARD